MPAALHVTHFNPWAAAWEPTDRYLTEFGQRPLPLDPKAPDRAKLETMARLDRAWYAETSRCFATLRRPDIEFASPRVTGAAGFAEMLRGDASLPANKWLVFEGHTPGRLAGVLPRLLPPLRQRGWRILYYSFDESSRRLPAFQEIAPHLSVLIHDEAPLEPRAAGLLPPDCVRVHRSWVANVLPFQAPWVENPEPKILFLGSKLGLTPHRQRQIDFLSKTYGDRFVAISDHSVPVSERLSLGRFKVGLCPEGRMFATPGMSATHTDRPFWSGCLGLVPVSENSAIGNRLDALHDAGLVLRYRHGNLNDLKAQCDRALAMSNEERRRIYEHFNREETVGSVVSDAIAN